MMMRGTAPEQNCELFGSFDSDYGDRPLFKQYHLSFIRKWAMVRELQ
jgi:hypothetical protein